MVRPKPLEPDVKAAKLEHVLGQCEDLFYTYGFKRVSMDEIVHHLGMSKKTLYQLVPTKDALIEAFVMRQLEKRSSLLRSAIEESEDILAASAMLLEHMQSDLLRVSAAMTLDLERYWPQLNARVEEYRQEDVEQYIERLASDEHGCLRDDLHRGVLTHVIETMVLRVLTPRLLDELNVSVSQAMRTVLSVMLGGILNEEGRQRLAAARRPS